MQRREFLKMSMIWGAGSVIVGQSFPLFAEKTDVIPQAVIVSGGEPEHLVESALAAYNGIQRFISKGDVVVIKPNIGWDRAPEFAANTNPEIVAAMVKACLNAGAKKVKIFDRTCNNPQRCYHNSQIEPMAKKYGAEVIHVRDYLFQNIKISEGKIIKEWPIYRDYLEADKRINIPIAKHHSLDGVTLGLKNLMGVMGGNRGSLHNHFAEKLIDIDRELLPELTIIDAYRILLRNGPVGGNLNDVKLTKTLIMSECIVTADNLALELFGLQANRVSHIKEAFQRGLHKYDPETLAVKSIQLN
ncbi:MAG: DUF362 domain-containing protein [Calditrichia bacterium]